MCKMTSSTEIFEYSGFIKQLAFERIRTNLVRLAIGECIELLWTDHNPNVMISPSSSVNNCSFVMNDPLLSMSAYMVDSRFWTRLRLPRGLTMTWLKKRLLQTAHLNLRSGLIMSSVRHIRMLICSPRSFFYYKYSINPIYVQKSKRSLKSSRGWQSN